MLYYLIKYLSTVVLKIFYSKIEIVGKENIPTIDAPIIFAPNHQNALTDAIILGVYSPLPIYSLTRSDVFIKPLMSVFKSLKMMPIYRIRDGYGKLTKNDAIFETCKNLLVDKKAILIFPEGNHSLDYFLRPLTKGICRIALNSQVAVKDEVKIIPVGLNFFDHLNSGSKLIVKFGKPINVKNYIPQFNQNNNQGYIALKKDISTGMKDTLIIPEKKENYNFAKTIFTKENEKFGFKELSKIARDSNDILKTKSKWWKKPLILLFSLANLPIYLSSHYIIHNVMSEIIFSSSVKIALGVIIFPIWLMLVFFISFLLCGLNIAVIVFFGQLISVLLRKYFVEV